MSFQYLQPENLPEARALIAQYGDEAKIIAGGSALVLMIRQNLIAPQVLVSLGKVQELNYERDGAADYEIGAMVSLSDLVQSSRLQARYPGLHSACKEVGNVRVRNQATLGGNLAEADYASDPPAMLLALDAVARVAGPSGWRSIPLADFSLGFYTTALEPDELLAGIAIPPLPEGARSTYLKYKSRSSEDRPCVGVAAVAVFEEERCKGLRVAIGAACETPKRVASLESLGVGERLTDELIDEIANGYAANIDTLEDLRGSSWYRKEMIRVFVRRALKEVRDGDR
jgi:carbon-monoxide dehydrogenase medium subunit